MDMEYPEHIEKAVAYVIGLVQAENHADVNVVDDVAANLGDENYGEIDPYQVLESAMEELGYDEETKAAVVEAAYESPAGQAHYDEDGGYSLEQLAGIFAEGVNVTIDNSEEYLNVDNSMYVQGDVHGDISQANYTEVVDQDLAEGAIAAGGDNYGQQQSGDGTQIGEAYGENIVTGDNNTTASQGAVIGNENVQARDIHDSEFGEGDKYDDESYTDNSDNSTNDSFNTDTADSFNTQESFNTTDSYDTEDSFDHEDNDYVDVDVDTGHGHGHGYEPPVEEHGYEPVAEVYEVEDDYEGDIVDVDVDS
jgi:hypothetical protein